jgi:hypothetical protein
MSLVVQSVPLHQSDQDIPVALNGKRPSFMTPPVLGRSLNLATGIGFLFKFFVDKSALRLCVLELVPDFGINLRINVVTAFLKDHMAFRGLLVVADLIDAFRVDISQFYHSFIL